LFADRKEFPNGNAERPNIRLGGKDSVNQRFNGHPLDRQSFLSFFLIDATFVDLARQSEIGNLDNVVIRQQNISSRQISVQHLREVDVVEVANEFSNKVILPFV
jgi:hypothetical protein